MSAAIRDVEGTKARILDAAERLFARSGVAGTSLRAVTAEAGVNVAAIHYHFGSKTELLRAIFVRRLAPINEERRKRLEACESAPEGVSLEGVIASLIDPSLEFAQAHPEISELAGLIYSEPLEDAQALIQEAFGETNQRFVAALGRCLPDVSGEEVLTRFGFMIGAMVMVISRRGPTGLEPATARPHLLRFLAAGLQAPALDPQAPARGTP